MRHHGFIVRGVHVGYWTDGSTADEFVTALGLVLQIDIDLIIMIGQQTECAIG